jgi:hypothetical protein
MRARGEEKLLWPQFTARFTPAWFARRRFRRKVASTSGLMLPPVARNHLRAIAAAGWAVSEDETIVPAKGKIVSIAVAASANIRREAQAVARHDHLISPVFKDGMVYVSTELTGPARGEVGGR